MYTSSKSDIKSYALRLVWGKTANHFPAKSVPLYIAPAMIYHHNINYKAKFRKATFRAQWLNNVSRWVRGLGNRWWLFFNKHLLCEKLPQFSQRWLIQMSKRSRILFLLTRRNNGNVVPPARDKTEFVWRNKWIRHDNIDYILWRMEIGNSKINSDWIGFGWRISHRYDQVFLF